MNLFVFCNNWDHEEDKDYHPQMVIAEDLDSAIKIYEENTGKEKHFMFARVSAPY